MSGQRHPWCARRGVTGAVRIIVGAEGCVVVMELQNGDDGTKTEDVLLAVD
jgi:hypothetical protein